MGLDQCQSNFLLSQVSQSGGQRKCRCCLSWSCRSLIIFTWEVPLLFSRLPMFPFFDLAHYVASVMALKEQRGAVEVSVRSPVACWFSAMLYCFGGSVLSSLMLAEPPVAFLAKGANILLASSVWYLVFYCPQDIFYRCFAFLPLRLLVAGMKEVTRTWKITAGIEHADSHFKDAWLVMVAVGWARGAGGGLISNFEQLVRGVWKPETNELLKMSYPVKVTLVGAVLFTLQRSQYFPLARHNLVFLYTVFLVVSKLLNAFFVPVQSSVGLQNKPIRFSSSLKCSQPKYLGGKRKCIKTTLK
uniref:Transmembrane protein 38B n=1 Tax=Strix occidentalis caurina TaxID=311401 RepID=A0A8D0FUH8_STROC